MTAPLHPIKRAPLPSTPKAGMLKPVSIAPKGLIIPGPKPKARDLILPKARKPISPTAMRRLEKRRKAESIKDKFLSGGLTTLIVAGGIALLSLITFTIHNAGPKEDPEMIVLMHNVEPTKINNNNGGGKAKGGRLMPPPIGLPTPPPASMKPLAVDIPMLVSIPMPDLASNALTVNMDTTPDFGQGWATPEKPVTPPPVTGGGDGRPGNGQGGKGGTGNGTGRGNGDGDGDGSERFAKIPSKMKNRCGTDARMARLLAAGGTPETEEAIIKALGWLKATQKADGSWQPNNGGAYPVAMTGFALMVFGGHCESPYSEEFGETITKAIVYLINQNKKMGSLSTQNFAVGVSAYEHAIGTAGLADAYTLCKSFNITVPELEETVKSAGNKIMGGQNSLGGWDYSYGSSETDNSIGFWQIQALVACQSTGLWPKETLQRHFERMAVRLAQVQSKEGAVGYRADPKDSSRLTGGALLAFQIAGLGKSKPARLAVEYLLKEGERRLDFDWMLPSGDTYYHYYNAQAMLNEGGEIWNKYHPPVRDGIVKAQLPDGSWPKRVGHSTNPHISTCLATLILQTYYRYLPPSQTPK